MVRNKKYYFDVKTQLKIYIKLSIFISRKLFKQVVVMEVIAREKSGTPYRPTVELKSIYPLISLYLI